MKPATVKELRRGLTPLRQYSQRRHSPGGDNHSMITTNLTKQKFYPSLFAPGLYSLQCVSRVSGSPDVTVYRENLADLIEGSSSQLRRFVNAKLFSHFVLAHDSDKKDVFDKRGKAMKQGGGPEAVPQRMAFKTLTCDTRKLITRSAWLVESPTTCGWFEGHAGQSAAERSNFYVMVDQLIHQAKNDKDREHLYLLSHHIPCANTVLIADLPKTSERTQGVYLDYFKRLRKGWPLQAGHHQAEMVRTFAGCRYAQLVTWVVALRKSDIGVDPSDRFRMTLAGLPAVPRVEMARIFVRALYEKFGLLPGGVECLSEESLVSAEAVMAHHEISKLLVTPMSKI